LYFQETIYLISLGVGLAILCYIVVEFVEFLKRRSPRPPPTPPTVEGPRENINQRDFRRDIGLLAFGVVMGILGGMISGLWSAYYVKWLESSGIHTNWPLVLIILTIALGIFLAYLTLWSIGQIRQGLENERVRP
jgi:hypothetical protein